MSEAQDWLTPAEAAIVLQVHRDTVLARLNPQHPQPIPHHKRPGVTVNGDRYFIRRADLEEWRAKNEPWLEEHHG
jgi:hypothetical protein